MSSRIEPLTDTRLASVNRTAASLRTQMYELDMLRDRVRKAQLSTLRSRRTNRRKAH
jgi:hypothetical protein